MSESQLRPPTTVNVPANLSSEFSFSLYREWHNNLSLTLKTGHIHQRPQGRSDHQGPRRTHRRTAVSAVPSGNSGTGGRQGSCVRGSGSISVRESGLWKGRVRVVKRQQAGLHSVGLGGRAAEHREKSTFAPMPGGWNLSWKTASDTHKYHCGHGGRTGSHLDPQREPSVLSGMDPHQGRLTQGLPQGLLGTKRAGWALSKQLAWVCLPSIHPSPHPAIRGLIDAGDVNVIVCVFICSFIHSTNIYYVPTMCQKMSFPPGIH